MIIALAGMPGAGKTTSADILRKMGFQVLRFGDITEKKLSEEGLEVNEKNERYMREKLREKYGMAAYAILNKDEIRKLLKKGDVVIDGMRSWQEFIILSREFGDELKLVAVVADDRRRHERLAKRKERPLTKEEAAARDKAEIEKLGTDEPVKKAPTKIDNNGSINELKRQLEMVVQTLKKNRIRTE